MTVICTKLLILRLKCFKVLKKITCDKRYPGKNLVKEYCIVPMRRKSEELDIIFQKVKFSETTPNSDAYPIKSFCKIITKAFSEADGLNLKSPCPKETLNLGYFV